MCSFNYNRMIVFSFLLSIISGCSEQKMALEPQNINFGVIEANSVHSRTVVIKNNTNKIINNILVKPSCTCTAIIDAPTVVQPNSTEKLRLTFTAPSHSKAFSEFIKVTLNEEEIALGLTGEATQTFIAKPNLIHGMLPPNIRQLTRIFEITSPNHSIAKIKHCDVVIQSSSDASNSSKAYIQASANSIRDQESVYGAVVFDAVRLRPFLPLIGTVQIEVELSSGESKTTSIPFTAIQKQEISISPKIISLSPNDDKPQVIIIRSTSSLEIESVHIDGVDMAIQYQTSEFYMQPQLYELTIRPDWKEAKPHIQKPITQLQINIKNHEQQSIPMIFQN